MNQKLIFLIVICISFIAVNSNSHAQKKYKFEKVVFGVDSIAKNSKGNNITGLIEKKTKKGKELGQYENGKKNGIYEFITPYDVVVKSETYQAGILNGPTKLFNMSGQLIESQNYSSGLLTGERNFYKAKQLIETQNYLNGKLHGKWIKWNDEHTIVIGEGNFINGKREGVFTTNNPGQRINKYEHKYQNGELKQLLNYRNDKLSSVLNYADGMLEGPVIYYETNAINQTVPTSYYYMHKNKYFGSRFVLDKKGYLVDVGIVGRSFSTGISQEGHNEWFTNFGAELWEVYNFNNKTTIQLIEKDVTIGSCELINGKGLMKIGENEKQETIEIFKEWNDFQIKRKYNNGLPKQNYELFGSHGLVSWHENGQKKEENDSVWNANGQLIHSRFLKEEPYGFYGDKNHYLINDFNDNGSQKTQYEITFTEGSDDFNTDDVKFNLKLFLNQDSITCFGESIFTEKQRLITYSPSFEKSVTDNGKIYTLSFSEGILSIAEYKDSLNFHNKTGELFVYDLKKGYGKNYHGFNSSLLNLPWVKMSTLVNGELNGFYCDEFSTGYYLRGFKTDKWVVNPEGEKDLMSLRELIGKLGLADLHKAESAIITYEEGKIKDYTTNYLTISIQKNDTIVLSEESHPNECYQYYIANNQLVREIKTINGNLISETFHNPQLNSKKKNIYSSNGTLENILEFKDNKVIKSILFNEKGEEVPTIKIGNQIWTAQNFDISHDRSGTIFTQAKTDKEWEDAFFKRKPAWCTSIYQKENGPEFGKLYNWYAMEYVAPEGWHVPSKEEWETLLKNLGGKKLDVTKILDVTTEDPEYQEWLKKNSYGFNARLGGTRGSYGDFEFKSYWWSTTEEEGNGAYALNINSLELSFENLLKGDGCFVRLIRDY
jgi:uncharacterized protein (TIGR02145 family)